MRPRRPLLGLDVQLVPVDGAAALNVVCLGLSGCRAATTGADGLRNRTAPPNCYCRSEGRLDAGGPLRDGSGAVDGAELACPVEVEGLPEGDDGPACGAGDEFGEGGDGDVHGVLLPEGAPVAGSGCGVFRCRRTRRRKGRGRNWAARAGKMFSSGFRNSSGEAGPGIGPRLGKRS